MINAWDLVQQRGFVTLWNLETGEEVATFDSIYFATRSAFSADSRIAYVSGQSSGQINDRQNFFTQWDAITGNAIQSLEFDEYVYDYALTSNGNLLIHNIGPTDLALTNLETGEQIYRLPFAFENDSDSFILHPNERIIAIASGTILQVRDFATGALIYELSEIRGVISDLAFTPDGRHIVSSSSDGTIQLWDIQSSQIAELSATDIESFWDVAVSPDGRYILSAAGGSDYWQPVQNADLVLWDIETGEEVRRFIGHEREAWSLDFTPDSQRIVSSSSDHTMRTWDVATGEQQSVFTAPDTPVYRLDVSPDGRTALITTNDSARLWDVENNTEVFRMEGHLGGTNIARFSTDGRLAVTGGGTFGNSGQLILRNIITGVTINEIAPHTSLLSDLIFLPDNQTVISSAWDTSVRMSNILTGEEIRNFDGITDVPLSIAISPDYTLLLSGELNGEVILRYLDTGEIITRFEGHQSAVHGLAFTPDGRHIVTGSTDGTVRVWEIPPLDLEGIISWSRDNRFLPEFTEDQCRIYHLDCASGEKEQDASFELITATPIQVDTTATPVVMPTLVPETIVARIGEQRSEFSQGYLDLWAYEGIEGENLIIRVMPDNPSINANQFEEMEQNLLDVVFVINSPDGEELNRAKLNDTDTAILNSLVLPVSGDYEIEVRGADYRTGGAYSLIIESDREE